MRLPRAAAMAAGLSWLAGACGEKADDGAGSTTTPSDSSTNSPYDGSANTPSDGPINTPSDGPPSSVSTSPVPLESVCEFYLEQYCTMLVQCGGSSETSVERCRAERDCRDLPDLRQELAAGWVEYDPAATGQCRAIIDRDRCGFRDRLKLIPSLPDLLNQCPGALVGKRPTDAICLGDQDCVSGTFCRGNDSPTGCGGTCQPTYAEGATCTYLEGICNRRAGLYCIENTCKRPALHEGDACITSCAGQDLWCDRAAKICRRPLAAGQSCRAPEAKCTAGLHCEDLAGQDGTCHPPFPVGAHCSQEQPYCEDGTSCVLPNPLLGTCRPPATAAGASCGTISDSGCGGGLTCRNTRCEPLPALGQLCDTRAMPGCTAGLVCVFLPSDPRMGTCKHPRYVGETCGDDSSVCVRTLCREGKCVARGTLGSPCTIGADCRSGACDTSGHCYDLSCWARVTSP